MAAIPDSVELQKKQFKRRGMYVIQRSSCKGD
jgi:hypothetical protein